MFLLDSNAWIVHLRTKGRSRVSQRLLATPVIDLVTCPIVRLELMVGALKAKLPVIQTTRVESVLAPLQSFPFDDVTADACAGIRADLERHGLPIGGYDYMIAATAVVHGLTLVTHNVRHFANVAHLQIEDWQ